MQNMFSKSGEHQIRFKKEKRKATEWCLRLMVTSQADQAQKKKTTDYQERTGRCG